MKETCYLHGNKSAEDLCMKCSKSICGNCVRFLKQDIYCPRCLLEVRRGQKRRGLLLGVSGLIASVALAGWGWMYWKKEQKREAQAKSQEVQKKKAAKQKEARRKALIKKYGYGDYQRLLRLREIVASSPCNLKATQELLQIHVRSSTLQEGLSVVKGYEKKCQAGYGMMEAKLRLQLTLTDYKGVLQTSGRMLRERPHSFRAFASRGVAYQKLGKLDKATRDLTQALVLEPRLADVPLRLANLEEKRGNYCQAAKALEHGLFHVRRYYYPHKSRIARLHKLGRCYVQLSKGQVIRIPFFRSGGLLLLSLKVAGLPRERFILDTGASISALSPSFAKKIWPYIPMAAPRLIIRTPNGFSRVPLMRLSRIANQAFRIKKLQVVVLPMDLGSGAKGLLGQNFLSHFRSYQIDNQRNQLLLASR